MKIIIVIWKFVKKMSRDRVRAYAAAASFFLIMSFFPFLMLLLSVIQFTPLTQAQVLETIEHVTPFEVTDAIDNLVGSIYNESYALLSTTAIAAVWASGKGMIGLSDGLNSVNHLEETRNYVMIRFRAVFHTVFMLIALIVGLGIMVFGYRLQELLRTFVPVIAAHPDVTLTLQITISLAILILLFEGFYVFLPNKPKKFRTQIPGAIFTSVAWTVFSYAFSIYLNVVSNMSVIYGGLTTLISVMLWLYTCMYLFFIGAEINCYIETPESFDIRY